MRQVIYLDNLKMVYVYEKIVVKNEVFWPLMEYHPI